MEILIAGLTVVVVALCVGAFWTYRNNVQEMSILKTILESSSDTILVLDYSGQAMSCFNKRGDKTTLVQDHFYADRNAFNWMDAESRKVLQAKLDQVHRDGKSCTFSLMFLGDVQKSNVSLFPKSPSVVNMVVYAQDVSPKYFIEMRDKVKLMEKLLDNLPIPTSVKDANDRKSYLIWNQKSSSLYNMTKEDLRTSSIESVSPMLAQIFADTDRETIKLGESDGIYAVKLPDGLPHTLSMHKKLITEADGRRWIVSAALDITEQEQQKVELERKEHELQDALYKASQSNRLKSEFIANISHEIRTPLNAIVGFSQCMADSDDAKERHIISEEITSNTQNLVKIIDGLIKLSQIETGEIVMEQKPISLHQLVNQALNGGSISLHDGVAVKTNFPEQEYFVIADTTYLIAILNSLLSNAVKFTDSGTITVGYSTTMHSIRLTVQDTGIGIAKDKHVAIFDRFEKNGSVRPGIGLGLSICKALVAQLGGSIIVDSAIGKGSTFTVELPLTPKTVSDDASTLSRFYSMMK